MYLGAFTGNGEILIYFDITNIDGLLMYSMCCIKYKPNNNKMGQWTKTCMM